jgi:hypothetical protein
MMSSEITYQNRVYKTSFIDSHGREIRINITDFPVKIVSHFENEVLIDQTFIIQKTTQQEIDRYLNQLSSDVNKVESQKKTWSLKFTTNRENSREFKTLLNNFYQSIQHFVEKWNLLAR